MRKIIIFISSVIISILSIHFLSALGTSSFPETDLGAFSECLDAYKLAKDWKDASKMVNISNPYTKTKDRKLVCKWNKLDEVLYWVALDLLFTQVDNDIETYLKTIKWVKKPVIKWQEISNKLAVESLNPDSFWNKYNKICANWIYDEVIRFTWTDYAKSNWIKLSTENWMIFDAYTNWCQDLYRKKLKAYSDAAWLILARETGTTYEKDKKEMTKKINKNYETLLNTFWDYLNRFSVLWNKWNRWEQNCNN